MALATQCPHCHTTFRVAQDQLKLRAGLVRCGHCKEIFNGIEHLLPPTAKLQPAGTPAALPSMPAVDVFPAQATAISSTVPPDSDSIAPPQPDVAEEKPDTEARDDTSADMDHIEAEPEAAISPVAPAASVHETQEAGVDVSTAERVDPLQRMTLVDFTRELPDDLEVYTDYPTEQLSHAEAGSANQPDALDEAIRDLQNKPWRSEKKSARKKKAEPLEDEEDFEEDEPGFLKRGRRKQRLGRRLRIMFGLGSLLLLIAALSQGAYVFRNQLAGSFPQTKPWLTQLCTIAGCRINLPAQISSVSIESSELQTLASAKNKFVLNTLLRNYSTTAQEWPYIELTLNDANEKPLLRRVFKPIEYLTSRNEASNGLPAASERTIKINFALADVQASGYRVYLFYP